MQSQTRKSFNKFLAQVILRNSTLPAGHDPLRVTGNAMAGRTKGFSSRVAKTFRRRNRFVVPAQLYTWKKFSKNWKLSFIESGTKVVASRNLVSAHGKISELQRILGRKIMETEILRSIAGIKIKKDCQGQMPS